MSKLFLLQQHLYFSCQHVYQGMVPCWLLPGVAAWMMLGFSGVSLGDCCQCILLTMKSETRKACREWNSKEQLRQKMQLCRW